MPHNGHTSQHLRAVANALQFHTNGRFLSNTSILTWLGRHADMQRDYPRITAEYTMLMADYHGKVDLERDALKAKHGKFSSMSATGCVIPHHSWQRGEVARYVVLYRKDLCDHHVCGLLVVGFRMNQDGNIDKAVNLTIDYNTPTKNKV